MESINGSEAWDDLLGFNNGVGGQMNCQDGKCVYLKCRAVEKMFMLENIQEIQSLFLFSTFLFFLFFFFFSVCRHETVGFTIARANSPRCNKSRT